MIDFIREAGWAIWPVFVFGGFSLAVAIGHAMRPDPKRLVLVTGASIATLIMGALGTVIGIQYSVRYLDRVADAERWIFLVGLREALNCMVAAFVLVALSTAFATLGSYRRAARVSLVAERSAEHPAS